MLFQRKQFKKLPLHSSPMPLKRNAHATFRNDQSLKRPTNVQT